MHSRQLLLYESLDDILAILTLLIHSLCYFDTFCGGILVDPLGEVLVSTVGCNDHFVLLNCECLKLCADYILALFIDLDDRNVDVE